MDLIFRNSVPLEHATGELNLFLVLFRRCTHNRFVWHWAEETAGHITKHDIVSYGDERPPNSRHPGFNVASQGNGYIAL